MGRIVGCSQEGSHRLMVEEGGENCSHKDHAFLLKKDQEPLVERIVQAWGKKD